MSRVGLDTIGNKLGFGKGDFGIPLWGFPVSRRNAGTGSATSPAAAADVYRGAESHACLCQVAAMLYYDWPSAARHFRRALALNPSTYVRLMYSGWHLVPLGRAEDAVLETR